MFSEIDRKTVWMVCGNQLFGFLMQKRAFLPAFQTFGKFRVGNLNPKYLL